MRKSFEVVHDSNFVAAEIERLEQFEVTQIFDLLDRIRTQIHIGQQLEPVQAFHALQSVAVDDSQLFDGLPAAILQFRYLLDGFVLAS